VFLTEGAFAWTLRSIAHGTRLDKVEADGRCARRVVEGAELADMPVMKRNERVKLDATGKLRDGRSIG
jgi:hypothetical protein